MVGEYHDYRKEPVLRIIAVLRRAHHNGGIPVSIKNNITAQTVSEKIHALLSARASIKRSRKI